MGFVEILCSWGLDHEPFGAMKIFIVLASRSRSKAAGASSMPAISEVKSATWSPPSVSREITSANSSTYVKQPSTRSSLTRIVSGSSPARPPPTTTIVPSGLEADGPLERRGDAVVQTPRATRLANAARVAVRVDADALPDVPAGHVASNASDPANGLVPHDEAAEVDLWGLGGVQVTSTDAAQVYVDEHLIVAGCRHRSALEPDAAIGPQDHRCHLGRSRSPLSVIGHHGSSSLAGATSLVCLPAIEVAEAARPGEVVGKQAIRITLGTDLL